MPDVFLLDERLDAQLRAAGIASPDDLFALGGNATSHRYGGFLELDLAGRPFSVYLKRYHYPGWRKSRGLIGRGTLWGTAPEVAEFRALAWLRAHDVRAVRPLAAASRTRGGRLVAHALLTEVIGDARDLATHMRTANDQLRWVPAQRRAALAVLGQTLGRMHRLGFVHRDCHARNILLALEGNAGASTSARVWLLDCRRGRVGGRGGPVVDLATLDQDLSPYFSRAERHRALAAYVDELGQGPISRALSRRIAAQRALLPPSRR